MEHRVNEGIAQTARTRSGLTVAAAVLAMSAGIRAQAPTPPPEPCRILGTVTDTATRAGVAGAHVVLKPAGKETDASEAGRFQFAGLAPGAYSLTAAIAGFSESAPVAITLAGTPCESTVDIKYRLAILAESQVEAKRPSEATLITSPVAPVLTGRAIAATPGGLDDTFRALQSQPGVGASQDNRNDLLVRGGGAIENQTRVDGFDLPNPNHFGAQGGTGGALSMIPPWLIDVASLEGGGFSAAFGERMSSVADIALREGRTDRRHGMLGAGVGGAMGYAEGTLGRDTGSWLASARRSLLEMNFGAQGDRAIPTYADALGRINWRMGPRHALTFLAIGAKDGVVVEDDKSNDQIRGDEWVGLGGVRLDSTWSSHTNTSVFASVGYSEVDAQALDGTTIDAIDRSREVEYRLRTDVRRQHTPAGDIVAGVAVKAVQFDYELLANGVWTPYEVKSRDIRATSRQSFADVAGFAELTRPMFSRGRVSAGMRLDRFGASGAVEGSPRVKAEFVPSDRTRLIGYWGIYRQSVPYIWMASAPGNLGLAPISSRQGGGGLEVEIHRGLRAGIEAFYKRYRDYPVDPAVPGRVLISAAADFESPYVGPLVGGGQVHARGVDTVATAALGSRLQLATNYSYWRVSQRGLDLVWRRAEHEMRHQARVELSYRPARQWTTGLRWRYVSGHPYTPFDAKASIKAGRSVYDLTAINTREYPPYHRLDVRGERDFVHGRTQTMIYVEVNNLYDRDNLLIYQWSRSLRAAKPLYQWGRTFIGGVRVEF